MAVVETKGRRKRATLLLEVAWDSRLDKFGPAPGLIMAVIETSPELRGLKVRKWGWVDTKLRKEPKVHVKHKGIKST